MALEQFHAIIKGQVQGVSFRHFTRQEAIRLGVTGWVRNRLDGSVEVIAQGPRQKLDELAHFLHNGPPAARVEEVILEWQPMTHAFEDFSIRFHLF